MKGNNVTHKKSHGLFFTFGMGEELGYFLENISSLLASGIPILEAINAVNQELRSSRLKKIINELQSDIESGKSLSESLTNSNLFSPHVSSLIDIGEKSGRLIENLKIIAEEQKKERSLRSKLRSASMYPMFVLSVTLIVGISIAWFILPKLSLVFGQLDVKLPIITEYLIKLGELLQKYGLYIIPSFLLFIVLIFLIAFSFKRTKIIGEFILFQIPGVKRLMKEAEIARFGYLLGTLISAGLSPIESLHSLSQATSLARYQKFYTYLKEAITVGDSFKKSFQSYRKTRKLFPVPVQQLIVAGEQSGTLSQTLIQIGNTYEIKTDESTKDLAVILEPILLVIVWLGVVAVALAVVLPIYSLLGGLNQVTDAPISSNTPSNEAIIEETPSKTTEIETISETPTNKLRILPSSTGYINLLNTPSPGGIIVGKVFSNEIYTITSEQNGWYEITFEKDKSGWIAQNNISILTRTNEM